MAAAVPPNQLILTLTAGVMGLTERQQNAITDNGWVVLEDFQGFKYDDIDDWISRVDRRPANRGGCTFGSVAASKLQALNFWINQELLKGHVIDNAQFDNALMRESMEDVRIARLEFKADSDAKKPTQFSYEDWVDWQQSVVTYLKASKSIIPEIPLFYVIRTEPCPIPINQITPVDEIVYNAPHNGRAFDHDNREVHRIIDELTLGTDAADWIKAFKRSQDGRAAWNALVAHYDGPAEGDKRVAIARSNIQSAFYKNESTFSFEKYSTRLKRAFDTLRQYNQPKSNREEVEILLKNINTNNTQLTSCIAICRDTHSNTFQDATTYLSTQIAQIFPQTQPGANSRNRARGPPRRRQVSKVVRKNGKVICNGVDITNTTRYFSKEEWNKLSNEGKQHLNDCPKRKAKKVELSQNKRRKTSAVGTNSDGNNNNMDEQTRSIAMAVINGVMHASQTQGDGGSVSGSTLPSQVQMPQHGTHAMRNSSATSSSSTRSARRQYDEYGNIVPN